MDVPERTWAWGPLTHSRKLSPPRRRASLPPPALHPSFFRHCIAQASESWWTKLSFEKCLLQNFRHVPLCTTLQGAMPLLRYMPVSGTSLCQCLTGTGYTGILYCESVPETQTSSPYVQRNKENVAQCTPRQKNVRATGLAGAKSPPSPSILSSTVTKSTYLLKE